MSDYKFNCPKCEQPIAGSSDLQGRQIECPTCKQFFVVPSPPAEPAAETATISSAVTKPQTAVTTNGKSQTAITSETTSTRIAVLSPETKIEIVQSVRDRIKTDANWLPGVNESEEYAYAAKVEDGKAVEVNVSSAEATRFSLMGAFLREFLERDVARNAQGRRRLLDQEIPASIKKVISKGDRDGEEREYSMKEILAISHEQCMEVLDVLEDRYRRRKQEASSKSASEKFGNVRVDDLLHKIERGARVNPEDTVIALFHELEELRNRLDRIEKRQVAPQRNTTHSF